MVGTLWYRECKTLKEDIELAAKIYKKKFFERPNTCYVNPKDNEDCKVDGIKVETLSTVLRGHLWIGVE